MRLPFGGLGLVMLTLGGLALPPGVAAQQQPGPGAYATAHALDELANAIAQGKITRTPTPLPTATPRPAAPPAPIATPTLEPAALDQVAEASPCWLTDQVLGDPDNGNIVFDGDGAPVPCDAQLADVEEPTPEPSPTLPPAAPAPAPVPRPIAPAAAPAAPQVRIERVVETVVVVVTPQPNDTPQPTDTPSPTATHSPTLTPTATPTATRTPTVTSTATTTPTSSGAALAAPEQPERTTQPMPWAVLAAFLGVAGLVLGALWIGVAIKRRTTVRTPRPPREDVYA